MESFEAVESLEGVLLRCCKSTRIVEFMIVAIAIPGSTILIANPLGSVMGAESFMPHLKPVLPFINDFTPTGVWLLVVFGVVPVMIALNLARGSRMARRATVVLRVVEISWIGSRAFDVV